MLTARRLTAPALLTLTLTYLATATKARLGVRVGAGNGAEGNLGVGECSDLLVGEPVRWVGRGDHGRAAQGAVAVGAVLGEAGQVGAAKQDVNRCGDLRGDGFRQRMLALYRCGRQADALAAYRRAGDLLAR
jgi:hypothetical protein